MGDRPGLNPPLPELNIKAFAVLRSQRGAIFDLSRDLGIPERGMEAVRQPFQQDRGIGFGC